MQATYTSGLHKEIPDQTPVELPLGYHAPETLEHMIQRLVQNSQLQAELSAKGAETFEEADDFDIEEEELTSPYELSQMQEDFIHDKLSQHPTETDPQKTTEPLSTTPKDMAQETLQQKEKPKA